MSNKDILNPLGRAFRFLALNRTTAAIFAMVILVGMGEKMAERFVPVYLMAIAGVPCSGSITLSGTSVWQGLR